MSRTQLRTSLERRFNSLNPENGSDVIDWEAVIDESIGINENLQILQYEYPSYRWEKQTKPKGNRHYEPPTHYAKVTMDHELIKRCMSYLMDQIEEFEDDLPMMNFYQMIDILQAANISSEKADDHRYKYVWDRTKTMRNSTQFQRIVKNLIALGLIEKKIGEKIGGFQIAYYFLTEKGKKFLEAFQS